MRKSPIIARTPKISMVACVLLLVTAITVALRGQDDAYENQYYELLRLKEQLSNNKPSEVRQTAQTIAKRVYDAYTRAPAISFEEKTEYFWANHGTDRSSLPLEAWPAYQELCRVNYACSPKGMRAQVFLENRPIYLFVLQNGTFHEFRWPWNGEPGMQTKYKYDHLGNNTRLRIAVDPRLLCEIGIYRNSWSDRINGQANAFKRMIDGGTWIGKAAINAVDCDVVLSIFDGDWDVFYVGRNGFIICWLKVMHPTDMQYDRIISRKSYRDIRTDPIPDNSFLSVKLLPKEAANWTLVRKVMSHNICK